MTEQTIEQLEKALADAKAKKAHEPFPKWVKPHASQIDRTADHVSTPAFPDFNVGRDGEVTVLVKNADEEAKATSASVKPAVVKPITPTPAPGARVLPVTKPPVASSPVTEDQNPSDDPTY